MRKRRIFYRLAAAVKRVELIFNEKHFKWISKVFWNRPEIDVLCFTRLFIFFFSSSLNHFMGGYTNIQINNGREALYRVAFVKRDIEGLDTSHFFTGYNSVLTSL